MKRREFLLAAGSFALAGAAAGGDIAVPAELRGGRLFAVPRTSDGRTFACWLDTNGSGFIFDWAVRDYGLATAPGKMDERLATLPTFDPQRTIPDLHDGSRQLSVFAMSGRDRRDPILRGFPAQLGASWFDGRAWRLDYKAGAVTLLSRGIDESVATVDLGFDRDYPQVPVQIGGERLIFAFDTAASVALKPEFSGGEPVSATSFITHALLDDLHTRFPDWPLHLGAGMGGVDLLIAPEIRVGRETMKNVAFTTRPGDDVFQGEPTQGKLGANAYANCIVTIDYPSGRLRIER